MSMSVSAAAGDTQKTLAIRPSQKFQGHSGQIEGVILLPGGQRIMTCSVDGSLRVWNLKTGEQIGDAWLDGESDVWDIALSPDGKKVVCGCKDGAVKLWDIDTGKFIAKWTGHTNYVRSVYWSRDYGRVVSASDDGTARVWDVESGKTVLAIETGLSQLEAVIYSLDMTMIAIGGESEDLKEFIKIWDAKTGKLITNLKGHTEDVFCLAWTADGSTLVSGSLDDSIRTWNTTTWQQIHILTGHTNAVCGIAISPNGPIIASASLDKTVRLWNLEDGLPIGSPLQHPHGIQSVSFSTDGKSLATGCYDNNAYSWDISDLLEEAGLLNPTDSNKSLIDADATRRPANRRRDVHRIPTRFFDDAPRRPDPSGAHHPSSSSAGQHNTAGHPYSHRRFHLGRLSSLFQRNNFNTHDAPSRPRFLEWARSTPFRLPHRRDNEGIQLQARRPEVVDVPVAQGSYRNYSAREARKEKEKEEARKKKEKEEARKKKEEEEARKKKEKEEARKKKEEEEARKAKNAQNTQNATNVSAGSSPPAQSIAIQQSRGTAQAQPSPQMHTTVSTLSTIPAVAATSAATGPVSSPTAIIPRAGRWTRFRLFMCCVSAQYTDDHN